jgi:cytidylate kinase
MRYRALTIAREYGSGGAEIASIVASSLGWRLVDKALITDIGNRARVPVGEAAVLDEEVDPWLHRITRPLWGKGADGFSAIAPVDMFDADAEATLARRLIEEAYGLGQCVIVGRGSQCILRGKDDVFHAFVYAAWSDRVRRVQTRVAHDTNLAELIHSVDGRRMGYVRLHYGEDQMDPHLYDVMVNSKSRTGAAAQLILSAMDMPW